MPSGPGIAIRASIAIVAVGFVLGLGPAVTESRAGGTAPPVDPPICVYQSAVPHLDYYFAVGVRNPHRGPALGVRDHVILIGTSASQAGTFHKREMKILKGYLA